MRILIISDTHGSLRNLEIILMRAGDRSYDRIIHLGDIEGQEERLKAMAGIPADIVRGNCDFFCELPDYLTLKIGRHNCLLTHGHLFNARRDNEGLIRAAKETGADYVFFGHNHRMSVEYEEGITIVNPGSLSRARDEGESYIVMDVDNDGEIHLSLNRI